MSNCETPLDPVEKRLVRVHVIMISLVGRALDCRAEGRGFDSRGRTNTQGLKINEKGRYSLCTASG